MVLNGIAFIVSVIAGDASHRGGDPARRYSRHAVLARQTRPWAFLQPRAPAGVCCPQIRCRQRLRLLHGVDPERDDGDAIVQHVSMKAASP
jgi:hypothetical protein